MHHWSIRERLSLRHGRIAAFKNPPQLWFLTQDQSSHNSSMEEGVRELPFLTIYSYIFGGVSFLYEHGPQLVSHMAVNGPIAMSIWIAQIGLHVLLKKS